MEVFRIQGGSQLAGKVQVSGSKNATLPIMAATLLASGPTQLQNVPQLLDVQTMKQLLRALGSTMIEGATGRLSIETSDESFSDAPEELVSQMRASVCVLGPLLAKRGYARLPLPGGCKIGLRPIDIHLKSLAALGASIKLDQQSVTIKADSLTGTEIDLLGPRGTTVLGTCNAMSAAVLAKGTTVLKSSAREPEVVALGDFLQAMGAKIKGHGTSTISIEGVDELKGSQVNIPPDRIEAATFMIAAAITRSQITLDNIDVTQLQAVIAALREIGVEIRSITETQVLIDGCHDLVPINLTARPYPGIPTDVQAQFTALLATVEGTSIVRDEIFPQRFQHCAELLKMKANIKRTNNQAIINGGRSLSGTLVKATDLRASAALVLAGLAARGTTTIEQIQHLDRGYESLELKLQGLGAKVQRVAADAQQQIDIDALAMILKSA